jgi:hypothetical protein
VFEVVDPRDVNDIEAKVDRTSRGWEASSADEDGRRRAGRATGSGE